MAENNPVTRLQKLGFEILNNTPDVAVCKIEPIGPEPDDGRWIDLGINEERCRALQQVGTIINVTARGINGPARRRTDEKPHLFIEVRKRTNRS
jgi:hypothetical protein